MTHSLTHTHARKKQLFDNCESIFAHTTLKKNHLSKWITSQIIFYFAFDERASSYFPSNSSCTSFSQSQYHSHRKHTCQRIDCLFSLADCVAGKVIFRCYYFLLFCHFLRFVCSRNASQSWFNTTTAITIETVGFSENFAVQWLKIRRFTKMQRQFICRRSRSAGMRRSLSSRDLVVKYSTRRLVRRVLQHSIIPLLTIFSTSTKRIHICAAIWKSQVSHSSILCWPHSSMEK